MTSIKDEQRHSPIRWMVAVALTAAALCALCGAADVARETRASIPWIILGNVFLPLILWSQRAIRTLSRRNVLILISASALGLRLLAVAAVPNSQVSDFADYHELAVGLASGGGYSLSGPAGQDDADRYLGPGLTLPKVTAFRAPGAPLWGALLGGSVTLFKVTNAVLSAGTCILIFLIMEPVGIGPATLAAILWAVYPAGVFAALLYGSEILYSFFIVLAAWLLSRRKESQVVWAASVGFCLAWCALIRPPAMLVWLAACVAITTTSVKDSLRRGVLLTFFVLLGLAPWALRNWIALHRVIPISTVQGISLGRQTASYGRRPQIQSAPPGDEGALAAEGTREGIRNILAEINAGPSQILADISANLKHILGPDSDLIRWASLQRYDPEAHPQADENRVISSDWLDHWLLINQCFYTGLLVIAAVGSFRKGFGGILALDGVRFLEVQLLGLWAILCVVPGVNRYHFSLMVPATIVAGVWGAKRSA